MGTSASSSQPIRRLLIVKMSSIGDVAHALPVVTAIKKIMPDLFLGWVVRRRCADLLRGNPDIDRLYVIEDNANVGVLPDLSAQLRADRYDTVFDMQGLFMSGLVSLISGAPRRIGLDRNRELNKLFMTDASVPGKDSDRHPTDILSGFLALLSEDAQPSDKPHRFLAHAERPFAVEVLRGLRKPVIALNTGASTVYKRWPLQYWEELAKWIVDSGGSVALLGGESDAVPTRVIEEAVEAPAHVRNLAGRTSLRQLAAVIGRCDMMVSGDTGPLHVATLIGTPTVSVYGPTSPRRTGPYGRGHLVLYKELPCSPCNRRPTCNGRVDCMKQITPEDVIDAVTQVLAKSGMVKV